MSFKKANTSKKIIKKTQSQSLKKIVLGNF